MIRKVKNLFHLLKALFANLIYRFPSKKLKVIGVTGTDGKTTTVHLIHHILKNEGIKTGLVSTIAAPGLHTTTPDPLILQKILRKMVNQGIKWVVLECSSHGLDQNRLWGIKFHIGVVTNITHDHLDYHKTYDNYLKAKAKLFKGVKIAVLNKDDKSYFKLKEHLANQKVKLITYGIDNKADFTPLTFPFKTKLPGKYNQYNCLAAAAVCASVGIKPGRIKKRIAEFKGVKGRMEEIKMGQKFRVIIDFAKTASGLENVLRTLRDQLKKEGRLIAVFGSAGLRDVAKRGMMGEAAGRLADIAVLTAEDPRTEDVNKIIDQIKEGCLKEGMEEGDYLQESIFEKREKKLFFRIPDRREAIKFAIQKLAQPGDIVIICGKGHERSMCFGKVEYPWSDQKEAKRALEKII